MNSSQILEIIGSQYPLIVRTECHVQIQLDKGKYHNFWPTRDGLKVRLYGMQDTNIYHNPEKLLRKLKVYNYKTDSDLSQMQYLERLLIKFKAAERGGVFCDAGFKDGQSKIAVIRIHEGDTDMHIRHSLNCNTNIEAEVLAIKVALNLYPNAPEIFSDCKPAVEDIVVAFPHLETVVKWIGREQNRDADKLANLRS